MRKKSQENAESSIANEDITPLMAYESTANLSTTKTRSRRNVSADIHRTDGYKNIEDGLVPWRYSVNYANNSLLEIRDAVILCQKAYYNFAQFRNVIDLMTELSNGEIYFKGASKKSREFFEAYFKKININSITDQFFREYYRSGNVFVYRLDSKMNDADIKKITQTFSSEGLSAQLEAKEKLLPSKYLFLNPADLRLTGSLNFAEPSYYKILSNYELKRLLNPVTEEDQELLESLPKDVRDSLKTKKGRGTGSILIPLTVDKVIPVFYKKQDYEPFAVPMGYPVLLDLNFKQELKKMDMAIARTMQQAILLVTMGTDPEKGGINQRNLAAMQQLFQNESVGRVLISDYTTKAEFVVPRISELMDPKKYEVFDRDINLGLNNILVGGEKFANLVSKVELFLSRLHAGRQAFVNNFLKPEIKRIAKTLGLKNYPTPYFDEITLSDNPAKERIYTRLYELGVLTAEEVVGALETNRLPDKDESLDSQKEFSELKNQGYYEPVIGGAKNPPTPAKPNKKQQEKPQPPKQAGRPNGTSGVPQESSEAKEESKFDFSKIKDYMILAQKLEKEVQSKLRSFHKIKRLNKKQKEVSVDITNLIVANEIPENWLEKAEEYVSSPTDKDEKRVKQIYALTQEHDIDFYLASLLLASKI